MHLFIAEKPSLARAIADALPGKSIKQKGYITVGDTIVTWCIGHLLEQAPPDAYGEQYKRWTRDTLPIVPTQWQWQIKAGSKAQLNLIKQLIKRASRITHAGDPDREGQLLVDEVLHYLDWQGPTHRVLISDLNLAAVKRALAKPRNNKEFRGLSTSALARSRADWLYGMNLTRAWTIAAKRQKIQSVLSVGRVQTPLLGLIVARDKEISNFHSHDYFDLRLKVTDTAHTIEARWLPEKSNGVTLDKLGHAIDRQQVHQIQASLPGNKVRLNSNDNKGSIRKPPKPFSLSKLQIAAGKRFKLQAKQVLDTCQKLYEQHKLITYPRSDSEYLPNDHHQEANEVISACSSQFKGLPWIDKLDSSRRSAAFNSSKVGAHHAIIPTKKSAEGRQLSSIEAQVYRMICEQYLAQFMPDFSFSDNKLLFNCLDHQFVSTARKIIEAGWSELLTAGLQNEAPLPNWNSNSDLFASTANIDHKKTKPPTHYTDATLIDAMSNIARFVDSSSLKERLKETDGLGTEATRANMIETLDKRGYIIRSQRKILSTGLGRGLIKSLPKAAITPDLTAIWEQQLSEMSEGKAVYKAFMKELLSGIDALITASDSIVFQSLQQAIGEPKCKLCHSDLKRLKSKRGWYWQCTASNCDFSASDNNGIPGAPRRKKAAKAAKTIGVKCPKCDSPLVERRSKRGNFWGCSGYPACKHTQAVGKTTLDLR